MSIRPQNFLFQIAGYFLIALAGVLCYFHALHFDFTYLDDNVWILDYQWFLRDMSHAVNVFTQPDLISDVFWRPILNLSFILNAQVSGKVLWGYRLVNLILHTLNGCLVFHLLRALKYERAQGLGFSLLFMVHPALVSSVVWIPGRTDSLFGTFIFGAFIFFLHFREGSKIGSFIGFLFLFLLALLTKETAVALPFVCLLYLFFCEQKEERKRNFFVLVSGLGIVVLLWAVLRHLVLIQSRHVGFWDAIKSVVTNSPALLSYLGKAVLPFNLSVLPIVADTTIWVGVVACVLIFVLLLLSKSKCWGRVFFGVGWFLMFLIPALVFSFLKHEYRLYVPLVGVMIVLLEIDWVKSWAKSSRRRGILFLACLMGVFVILNIRHARHYKNQMTFWKSAVETSPHSPLAHRNLGAMYYLEGRMEEAQKEFEEALILHSREPMVHNNLGLIYAQNGMLQEAQNEYLAEIAVNPTYDNVYYNLGLLFLRTGQNREAEAAWKKSIELEPKQLNSYRALAAYYYNAGDTKRAAVYFQELEKRGVVVPPEIRKALSY